jgi:hypothetical protein
MEITAHVRFYPTKITESLFTFRVFRSSFPCLSFMVHRFSAARRKPYLIESPPMHLIHSSLTGALEQPGEVVVGHPVRSLVSEKSRPTQQPSLCYGGHRKLWRGEGEFLLLSYGCLTMAVKVPFSSATVPVVVSFKGHPYSSEISL